VSVADSHHGTAPAHAEQSPIDAAGQTLLQARHLFETGSQDDALVLQRQALLALTDAQASGTADATGRLTDAWQQLAHYHRAMGDIAAARAELRRLLGQIRGRSDVPSARIAQVLDLLGLFAAQSNDLHETRVNWTEAVALKRAVVDTHGIGQIELALSLLRMGQLHANEQKWDEAAMAIAEAADHFERDPEARQSREFVDALNLLATAHHFAGRPADAVAAAEQAMTLARHRAERGGEAERIHVVHIMNNLARIYLEAGRPADARSVLSECVASCRALIAGSGNPMLRNLLAAALNRLGHCHASLGEQDAAAAHLGESVAMMRELVEKEGHAELADDLALAAADLERMKQRKPGG
jgi:tetratricopeptide (TPR) repeat protein